jgi:intracellular multiplication protein IcmL
MGKKIGGLDIVVMRNIFYRDNYRRTLFALLLVIVINCVLAGTIMYRFVNPPAPQYFATNGSGRLIHWHPLTDPVVSDSYVLQWAASAVRRTFSLDYMHWRQQLQDASAYYTPGGWKNFLLAMKPSNNLNTLTSLKMVANAKITGAPQLLEKEVVGGRYAWKVEVPILVTFDNKTRSIPMPMKVVLIILRVPIQKNPQRIAINNFLPQVQLQNNSPEAQAITGA